MKKLILLFFIVFCGIILNAQNLVFNPSFELNDSCADNLGEVSRATGWTQINSADYFNVCNTLSQVGVPNNYLGYQCPSSGSAYCGFYLFAEWWQYGVEFIQGQFINPMIVGQKYYVNLKVNMANGSNCGNDKIGVIFTNVFYGDTIINYISGNFAHIYSTTIITDTINWISIRGSYVADSSYKYILIGNFFDTSNVNLTCYSLSNRFSYYYIDDICVSIDSLTCEIPNDTNICDTIENTLKTNLTNESITIYPNPTLNYININCKNTRIRFIYYTLFDTYGRLIKENKIFKIPGEVDISSLPNGLYFLRIQLADINILKKVIINH